MKRLIVSASSRIGLVRSKNEDMILVADKKIRDDRYSIEMDLSTVQRLSLALADGMGGYNAGEVASAETLDNLSFFVNDLPEGLDSVRIQNLMNGWLESINMIITSKGHENARLAQMGTTLVALVYYYGRLFLMNCGDSRLYRLRDGELEQLTVDHSVNTLLGEKKHHYMLINNIGGGCRTPYFDFVELSSDVRPHDIYMLCSDGLNDMVPDHDIRCILTDGGDADRLCDAAIEAGGCDNVSVCVITVL